ncbi:unnamed protein product [Ectocarpus sp. 4 AP-2014]
MRGSVCLLFIGATVLVPVGASEHDSLQDDNGRKLAELSHPLSVGIRGSHADDLPRKRAWRRELTNNGHGGKSGHKSSSDSSSSDEGEDGGGRHHRGGGRGSGGADFLCENGILEGGYCCSKMCGEGGCGGTGCGSRNDVTTADDCCFSHITELCSVKGCAPCMMDEDDLETDPEREPVREDEREHVREPEPEPEPKREKDGRKRNQEDCDEDNEDEDGGDGENNAEPEAERDPESEPEHKPEREPKRKPEREPKRGKHGRKKKPNQEDCDEDSEQEDDGEEEGDEESDGDGSCCNKTSELLRVVVDDGIQEEVYSNGPISIFAGCVADIEGFPASVILSVLVTPEDSDSGMEYVMTSWEDVIQTATSDAPYSTLPTSPNLAEYTWTDVGSYGMISIATASGHYVGFDGSSIMARVVSSEEEPGWGCASRIKDTDDMETKRCIIMGPLEVY